ncbi:MAG: hypothetical protein ABIH23_11035, partial [bacterium]
MKTMLLLTCLICVPIVVQSQDTVVPSRVSDYEGTVWGVALGVERSGPVHVLWTGERPTDQDFTLFYAKSNDGIAWSPYEVLDNTTIFDPVIVTDEERNRVHLLYRSNENGILHRVIESGVMSQPKIVDSPPVLRPSAAVDLETGKLCAVWGRVEMVVTPSGSTTLRYDPYIGMWDGSSWSEPRNVASSASVWDVAVGSDGQIAVAWLETNAGIPTTRFATADMQLGDPVPLALGYPYPEKDDSVSLGFSPLDGRFHALTSHLLWAGSSDIYHFRWEGDRWSSPENISSSPTPRFSARPYFGSSADVPFLYYSWMEALDVRETIFSRADLGGILAPIEDVGQYFENIGVHISFTGMHKSTLGADGFAHLVIGESQYQSMGMYYLRLPEP